MPAGVVRGQENSVCICKFVCGTRTTGPVPRIAAVRLFLQVCVNHGTTLPIEQLASADIPQSACETYPPPPNPTTPPPPKQRNSRNNERPKWNY